jgi:hypothetical protein
MTNLDTLILVAIDRCLPDSRDLNSITQEVISKLSDKERSALLAPQDIGLYRRIRRRVRDLLRHDPRQQTLPGLQDNYSTEARGAWVSRTSMTYLAAIWTLTQLDRVRKKAEEEYEAFAKWIREAFPEHQEEKR